MDFSEWLVLVVEDEYDSVQMVSKILNHHGIEAHVAGNGVECLEMLAQMEPTIIVMDLAMPEMDGWETLVAIRSNPETAHIPVVAMTAYHSVDVASDAIEAGFDSIFPKPINARSFVDSLVEIVSG